MWEDYFATAISFNYDFYRYNYEIIPTNFKLKPALGEVIIKNPYVLVEPPPIRARPRSTIFIDFVKDILREDSLSNVNYGNMLHVSNASRQEFCLTTLAYVADFGMKHIYNNNICGLYVKHFDVKHKQFMLTNLLKRACYVYSEHQLLAYDILFDCRLSMDLVRYMYAIEAGTYCIATNNYEKSTILSYKKISLDQLHTVASRACNLHPHIMSVKGIFLTGEWLYMMLTGYGKEYSADTFEYFCENDKTFENVFNIIDAVPIKRTKNKIIYKYGEKTILITKYRNDSFMHQAIMNNSNVWMKPQYAVGVVTKTIYEYEDYNSINPKITACGIGYVVPLSDVPDIIKHDLCYRFFMM